MTITPASSAEKVTRLTQVSTRPVPVQAPKSISSLLQNPAKGMMPTKLRPATTTKI